MKNILLSELKNRLHGYKKAPKADYLLLSIGMKEETWLFYSFCKNILVDWDQDHIRYKHLRFDHRNVESLMLWKKSKTNRLLNSLLDIGAIQLVDKITKTYRVIEVWNSTQYGKTPFEYIEDLLNEFEKSARKPELVIKMREKLNKKIEIFSNMGNDQEESIVVISKEKPIYKSSLTMYKGLSSHEMDISHEGFDGRDVTYIDIQQEENAKKVTNYMQ